MRRRRPHAVRLASAALLAAALAPGLAACSGDDPTPSEVASTAAPAPTPTPEPERVPAVTESGIARVDGRLAQDARERLRDRVTAAVDAWIDAAYGGDYPRDDFSTAFDSFTDGAKARALTDESLMSNARIGLRVDDVFPVERRVRLDVLGVAGTAVGVTARVRVVLELTGDLTRTDVVTGSLFLSFDKDHRDPGWHVFGYDMYRKVV